EGLIAAFRALLMNEALEPGFRALAASLPDETYLLERMKPADPGVLRKALVHLMAELGRALADEWLDLYKSLEVHGAYRYHPADAGRRALRNLALRYLVSADVEDGVARAETQCEYASNMTECLGALSALVLGGGQSGEHALETF